MRIYLLRHARAEVIDGDFYGAGLSLESAAAADALARSGVLPRPDILMSSPFRRAMETAAPFAEHFGLEVDTEPVFAEWKLRTLNLGDEAHHREEQRGFEDEDTVVEGGESLSQMRTRVLDALDRLQHRDAETVLVTTHGTVIHLICAHLQRRRPTVDALRSTAFLDYAVIESNGERLNVVRDIVRAED